MNGKMCGTTEISRSSNMKDKVMGIVDNHINVITSKKNDKSQYIGNANDYKNCPEKLLGIDLLLKHVGKNQRLYEITYYNKKLIKVMRNCSQINYTLLLNVHYNIKKGLGLKCKITI